REWLLPLGVSSLSSRSYSRLKPAVARMNQIRPGQPTGLRAMEARRRRLARTRAGPETAEAVARPVSTRAREEPGPAVREPTPVDRAARLQQTRGRPEPP